MKFFLQVKKNFFWHNFFFLIWSHDLGSVGQCHLCLHLCYMFTLHLCCTCVTPVHSSCSPKDNEVEDLHHHVDGGDHSLGHWMMFIEVLDDQEPKVQGNIFCPVLGVPPWSPTWASPPGNGQAPLLLLPPFVENLFVHDTHLKTCWNSLKTCTKLAVGQKMVLSQLEIKSEWFEVVVQSLKANANSYCTTTLTHFGMNGNIAIKALNAWMHTPMHTQCIPNACN